MHRIRSQILFDKRLSETMESINRMCLKELLWLYEEQVIMSKLEEAAEKDQKYQDTLGKTKRA